MPSRSTPSRVPRCDPCSMRAAPCRWTHCSAATHWRKLAPTARGRCSRRWRGSKRAVVQARAINVFRSLAHMTAATDRERRVDALVAAALDDDNEHAFQAARTLDPERAVERMLVEAARRNRTAIVDRVFVALDANAADRVGERALVAAASAGAYDAFVALGAHEVAYTRDALLAAAESPAPDALRIVDEYIDARTDDPAWRDARPAYAAAYERAVAAGRTLVARHLIDAGLVVDTRHTLVALQRVVERATPPAAHESARALVSALSALPGAWRAKPPATHDVAAAALRGIVDVYGATFGVAMHSAYAAPGAVPKEHRAAARSFRRAYAHAHAAGSALFTDRKRVGAHLDALDDELERIAAQT